ncbi:hypothetical protein ACU4GD_08720 [Cupriavidus basilensis]
MSAHTPTWAIPNRRRRCLPPSRRNAARRQHMIASLRDASEGTPSVGRRVAVEAVVTADYSGFPAALGEAKLPSYMQADARRQDSPRRVGRPVRARRARRRAPATWSACSAPSRRRSGQMQLRQSGPGNGLCIGPGPVHTPAVITLPVPHTQARCGGL